VSVPLGLRARLLAPLGALGALAAARRMRGGAVWRAPLPVIAVDSLTGEDDHVAALTTALAMRLRDRGLAPALLLRGAGGRQAGPLAVDLRAHAAADVGDAALLAAAFAPTWVAADRVAGARALCAAGGAEGVVMEGGIRDPALHTDLAILVVDAGRGFGNARGRPAGPMRAPLGPGLARADLVVSVGERAAQAAFAGAWGARITVPRATARLVPLRTGMDWRGLRVLAFAGTSDRGRFFEALRDLGARPVREVTLSDHQPLTRALMTRMLREARRLGAQPVTTETDAARLPADLRPQVLTLPLRLELEDGGPVEAALDRAGIGGAA